MAFNLQPTLENDLLLLRPMQEDDFEPLFKVASDPLIWEQHPSKERATREGFTQFFKDAMATKAAFVVIDKKTGHIIGTSRYNPVPHHDNAIEIGWTFLARSYWGSDYNPSMKKLMMDYAFQYVPHILFFVNAQNMRSQKAVEKIGGERVTAIDGKLIELKALSTVVFKVSKINNKMDTIEIRKANLAEINQLQQIGKQTFFETFSANNTEENMKTYLEDSFSIAKLTSELTDPNTEFYFAILDNHVIGYLKLNFGASQTELKDNKALEIERIYVLKEFHGKKVGQILYDKAVQVAKQMMVTYVWLGVWEKNPRAISFYKKNGFIEFDKHIFVLGDDEQTDIMMKLQFV